MKNKFLNLIKDSALKSIVILLVVIVGFYAYASINWPSDPNPVSGVVGMFVGSTETVFSTPSDYKTVNGWCETGTIITPDGNVDGIGAHVCTPDEMINSYNHGNDNSVIKTFYTAHNDIPFLWINSGPPAYAFNANDCEGWTNNTSKDSGTAWDMEFHSGFLQDCNENTTQFACCK